MDFYYLRLISSGVQALGTKIEVIQEGGKTVRNIVQTMNKDLMNALTIASGGLSGGIGSVIAGGNFWQGMRQGLITSGLNHAAHSIQKRIEEKVLFLNG